MLPATQRYSDLQTQVVPETQLVHSPSLVCVDASEDESTDSSSESSGSGTSTESSDEQKPKRQRQDWEDHVVIPTGPDLEDQLASVKKELAGDGRGWTLHTKRSCADGTQVSTFLCTEHHLFNCPARMRIERSTECAAVLINGQPHDHAKTKDRSKGLPKHVKLWLDTKIEEGVLKPKAMYRLMRAEKVADTMPSKKASAFSAFIAGCY